MTVRLILLILTLVELALAFFFVVGLWTGKGTNFLLGTIFGLEFILLAAVVICYIWLFIPTREVAEDREEGLLW
jgi:hypothetical protein